MFNYQNKVNENLIIEVPLRNIEILKEPLDFYSALNVSLKIRLRRLEWNHRLVPAHLSEQSLLGFKPNGTQSDKKIGPKTAEK